MPPIDEEQYNRQLISKRGVMKRQVTQFSNFLNSLNPDALTESAILNLEMCMQNIENLQTKYNQLQDEIEFSVPDDEAQGQERDVMLQNIVSCLVLARSYVRSFRRPNEREPSPSGSNRSNSNNSESRVKLPQMQIPTFKGAYDTWVEFRDMFSTVVHDNPELSNIQRLYYLRASLSGEAASLIRSIQSSHDNYAVAWQLLLDRYENNNLIVHNHVKCLFELQPLQKETASGIRNIVDVVQNNLRALKNLKQPTDSWDTLIIYIVTSKLDNTSRREWEIKRGQLTQPVQLNDLLDHLKSRSLILETLTTNTTTDLSKQGQHSHHSNLFNKSSNVSKQFNSINNNNKFKISSYASTYDVSCNFCNQKHHQIYKCDTFLALPVDERREKCKALKLCTNCLRTGHLLNQCKLSHCLKCPKYHNTLLHNDMNHPVQEIPIVSAHASQFSDKQILLSTAQVLVKDAAGNQHVCRALLDSGSQTNIITDSLAKKLKLDLKTIALSIYGINQVKHDSIYETRVHFQSHASQFNRLISGIVLPKITHNLPMHSFSLSQLTIPTNIKLADQSLNVSSNIDLLIGAELFYDLLCSDRIHFGRNKPVIQKTVLGWIISGSLSNKQTPSKIAVASVCTLEQTVNKFGEIDLFPTKKILTKEEEACETFFERTHSRDEKGRFLVRIPFNEKSNNLSNTRAIAESRYLSLERKLCRNPLLKEAYDKFMQEYIDLNHMTESTDEGRYYLPHHAVLKDSSTTKLRVVFDGSCKSAGGLSLNEIQHVGPVVQSELYDLILKFRCHGYVITADIQKMYRQIIVHTDDRPFQQILWRFSSSEKLRSYQLNTVTYGTSSAPFLATHCLNQLARDHQVNYPLESEILTNDTYVDDILTGTDCRHKLEILKNNSIQLLALGGFTLHKWLSNVKNVGNNKTSGTLNFANTANIEQKTLGIYWNSEDDTFYFSAFSLEPKPFTKRNILSSTAKIFDPLGVISPVTIIAKIIIQALWKCKLYWDTPIDGDLQTRWLQFVAELKSIPQIRIPRFMVHKQYEILELHGFADASEKAYGACIYIRSISRNKISCSLVTSKSKVAPLQIINLPRLELCAALLLARLMNKVRSIIPLKN